MSYKVRILADTVNPCQHTSRIVSFEMYAPRFLLAEVNTHSILAKSAQSSRAVPVSRRIEAVERDSFVPSSFGKNKRGMQADEKLSDEAQTEAREEWMYSMRCAVASARKLEQLETHKQHANRLIEPYSHYYGIITGTEWENFFNLRTAATAQPEFQEIANAMLLEYARSKPAFSAVHLPYIEEDLFVNHRDVYKLTLEELFMVSAARCARVSYKYHDGTEFDVNKDLRLCEMLIESGHLSPFEHPAKADATVWIGEKDLAKTHATEVGRYWSNPADHRKFWGWIAKRVDIERDKGLVLRRDSYSRLA